MRNFFLTIFCVTVVFLHTSSAGVFFGPESLPNLTLALAVSLTLVLGFRESLVWIFLVGMLIDVYSGWTIGVSALILAIIAWAISGFSSVADIRLRRLYFLPILFFLSAGLVFAYDILAQIFMRAGFLRLGADMFVFGTDYLSGNYFLKVFLTALSVFAIYYITAKINRFFSRPAPVFVKK